MAALRLAARSLLTPRPSTAVSPAVKPQLVPRALIHGVPHTPPPAAAAASGAPKVPAASGTGAPKVLRVQEEPHVKEDERKWRLYRKTQIFWVLGVCMASALVVGREVGNVLDGQQEGDPEAKKMAFEATLVRV